MKQADLAQLSKEIRRVFKVFSLKTINAKYGFILVALAEGYSELSIANYFKMDRGDIKAFIFEAKKLFENDDDFAEKVRELL